MSNAHRPAQCESGRRRLLQGAGALLAGVGMLEGTRGLGAADGGNPPVARNLAQGDAIGLGPVIQDRFQVASLLVTDVTPRRGLPSVIASVLSPQQTSLGNLFLTADTVDRGSSGTDTVATAHLELSGMPTADIVSARTRFPGSLAFADSWYVQVGRTAVNYIATGVLPGPNAVPIRVGPVYQQHTFRYSGKSATVHQPKRPIPLLPMTSQELRDAADLRARWESFAGSSGARTFLRQKPVQLLLSIVQDDAVLPHLPLISSALSAREAGGPADGAQNWLVQTAVTLAVINLFLST